MREPRQNWAGNYTYHAATVHEPATLDDLQDLVRRLDKLKVLGTRHAFNDIADTPGAQISLRRFDRVLALDPARRTIMLEGGVRYGELGRYLHQAGYALHNLASLPHISVAGACATATHGSGDRHGNLATAVAAMEVVTAGGEVVRFARDRPGAQFAGAVVGLGGLGVITRLTLDVEPAYAVRQDVYEGLPLAQLAAHFDAIVGSADSVSLFTDWRAATFHQVWLKRRVAASAPREVEAELFGARLATGPRHPIPGLPPENCTPQLGVPGPWHERWPHFRLEFTPSSGAELQSEYLVPRHHACAALDAIQGLREHVAPLLQVSEVRTVAADGLWMSPCYAQSCVGIHFTWQPAWEAVQQVLPRIEAALAPFAARPHWGKLFTSEAARLAELYPKLPDFQRLLRSYDPQGKFRNAFLDRCIFGQAAGW